MYLKKAQAIWDIVSQEEIVEEKYKNRLLL